MVALIERCRQHTDVPIGVGFGISSKEDMDFLRGHADMAIIGTASSAFGSSQVQRVFASSLNY